MPITIRRVRHETRFRRAAVVSNQRITPRMARVVIASPELEGFVSAGFDDHIRLFLPAPGAILPVPTRGENGMIWPEPRPISREYTPRAFDAGRGALTLDFVIHDGGPASDWAIAARPGDEVGIAGPRGSFVVEGQGDWHLLMGDATALPAIGRRIEELPAGTRIHAVIEVEDEAEQQGFDTAAELTVTWLHAASGQGLARHLDDLTLPAGEGFAFFAAEASVVDKARERFARLGQPSDLVKAANYWRRGVADSH